MAIRVGINGFGRIGRQVLKAIMERSGGELEVVAVNDLFDTPTNAHLLKFDTNYGILNADVEVVGDNIAVNGKEINVYREKDPTNIPWKDDGVEIVIESTGVFRDKLPDLKKGKPGANVHIEKGGAKKVIISAPAKNEDLTICLGVNQEKYDPANHHVVSNASCTTNCLAPVAKVLNDLLGIEYAMMTTIHSYTNDQRILDLAHEDLRRARAAAMNIIPTSTGAAKAVALVIPELKGKFDGTSLRVPTATVSIVDLVCMVNRSTTVEEVNNAFKAAAEGPMKGILGFETRPLVSSDFKGDDRSSIIDAEMTMVKDKMVKVFSWYDNEWGYSCRTADLAAMMAKSL